MVCNYVEIVVTLIYPYKYKILALFYRFRKYYAIFVESSTLTSFHHYCFQITCENPLLKRAHEARCITIVL